MAESREFVRGAARMHDLVYILCKGKVLLKQNIAHTRLTGLDRGAWGDNETTTWDSTAIAVAKLPSERLVFVGEDGEVCTYVGGKSTTEQIEPAPKLIRNARTIDGYVVACGMLRQVYRRTGEATWTDISAPSPRPGEKVGFEAIDGISAKEIYAVGWSGEIWEYDGSTWVNRPSGTGVILSAVCCAGDGVVYAAGQEGVMLKGRHDKWERVEWKGEVTDDLCDLCWFNDKLYVATMTALYTLEGNQLVAVDFGELGAASCYNLTQAEGVLWSIGPADVLSFDGKTWRHYD